MLSASQQVTKVIDAKGDEAELASMVRKERATGSEAMAVNSEGEVSSLVRRHTDNQDLEQEDFVDAPEDDEDDNKEEQDQEPQGDEDEANANALMEEQDQEPQGDGDENEEGQIEVDSVDGLGERDDDIMHPEQEVLLEEQEQGPEDDEESQITADPQPEDGDVIEEERPEDLKAALDEARARDKAAGEAVKQAREALKTAKEKVNATEEAQETRNAREKLREMVKDSAEKKAWEEARARLNQTEAFTEKETALQAFKKAKEERQTARRARQAINDAKKLLKAFTPNAKKASRKASKKASRKASPVAHGTVVWNPEDPAETKTEEIDTEGQTPADLSQDAEKVMNDPNIVSLPQITADPTDDNATEAPETPPATLGVSTLGGPENGGHYGSEATLG